MSFQDIRSTVPKMPEGDKVDFDVSYRFYFCCREASTVNNVCSHLCVFVCFLFCWQKLGSQLCFVLNPKGHHTGSVEKRDPTELQPLTEAHFIWRKKDEEELMALVNRIVSLSRKACPRHDQASCDNLCVCVCAGEVACWEGLAVPDSCWEGEAGLSSCEFPLITVLWLTKQTKKIKREPITTQQWITT